jgi:hypothetical protein
MLYLDNARTIIELERLASEVAERVRPVCAHLSEAELFSLALAMAAVELKYIGLASLLHNEAERADVIDLHDRRIAEAALAVVRAQLQ